MKTQLQTLIIAAMLVMLVACGGGGANIESTSTTMGQELLDLDESYKKGLLSEKEYEKARKNIMKRYN